MLTPQEVSERGFTKASFGGYNMAMVDEFLDVLTVDYSALYNENAVLKSKLKVLVDKVEEYRSTEEAMRKALMTAQRMADELVHEAEQKKETMLQDAQLEVAAQVAGLRKEINEEEFRLAAAKKATAEYVAKVQFLHKQAQDWTRFPPLLCPSTPWMRPCRRSMTMFSACWRRLRLMCAPSLPGKSRRIPPNLPWILSLP